MHAHATVHCPKCLSLHITCYDRITSDLTYTSAIKFILLYQTYHVLSSLLEADIY